MNLLIYLEPLHELDNPFWHEAWLGFADRMATALKRRWPEARTVCVTNRALAYAKPQAPFDIVVLDHTELVPRFGATAAAVAAHWDAGGNDDSNTAMAALLRARLGGFEPGVCVSFSPAPFLRTAFPEAPALFFEHGMVSRPPFPLTGYLDPFDIVRGSALVRLKDEVRGFQPTAAETAFVAELRERYFGHIESGNRLTATVASWREKFPRLVLLAGQFSNFYAFDCYAANKTPLDLVLHALAAAGPSVGVIVTEHPNHPFLNERMVEWLAASHPNFLWSPEFNATTWRAASQWLMAHVDAVATVSSKVGLETLLWRKPLLVLGSSHLDTIADSHDLAELDAVCARPWPAWKDAVLAWHLTRYTMPFDLLFETDLFCDRLELALAQHRSNNRDAAFDVAFAPIDDIRRSYDSAMTAYGVGAGGPAATKAPEPMQPTADDSLSNGSDQAMADTAEQTAETDRLKEEAANLQAQLDAVHASTSWRLTAPLRAVSRMLGRGPAADGSAERKAAEHQVPTESAVNAAATDGAPIDHSQSGHTSEARQLKAEIVEQTDSENIGACPRHAIDEFSIYNNVLFIRGWLEQGCSVLWAPGGFPSARMCESIGDNPNRRLSRDGIAAGDPALYSRPSPRRRPAVRTGDSAALCHRGDGGRRQFLPANA